MAKGKRTNWKIFASETMKPIIYEDEKQATIEINKQKTDLAKVKSLEKDANEEVKGEDECLQPVHQVRTFFFFFFWRTLPFIP